MIASEETIARARRTYGRSIEEILSKESDHDLFSILGAIEVLVGSKIYQKLPTSPAERMVFSFTWLAREVQNGGFHQFFTNSAGDFWKDILHGLQVIGDDDGKTSFLEVLSIFQNSEPSQDRNDRLDELELLEDEDEEKVWSHFREKTDQYFSAPFPNWQLVFDYVKSHPSEFDLQKA